jgi:ABC-type Fe3+-hydroxamate transport system substrate-binding protein
MGTELVLALGHGERLVAVDAASEALPGARGVPVTEGARAGAYAPDLVLVPTAEADAVRRAAPSALHIEVAPHNFDDAWALCQSIGAALGNEGDARRFVRETTRPLAELGVESFGKRRPRVAAVLALEPLEIAGGHSFETDLIELAGGESVSHGTEEPRLRWSAEQLAGAKAELIVIVTAQPHSPAERERISHLFAADPPVEFLVLDAERDWLTEALPAARRLRAWIERQSERKPWAPRSGSRRPSRKPLPLSPSAAGL